MARTVIGMSNSAITRIDFVPIPTQDTARATAFYRDTLGLAESPPTVEKPFSEIDLGGTTLSFCALHTDDVQATRAELEAKGVQFVGATLDTGVCHMAFFADPDGNPLMLHGRYVPR